MKKNKAAVSRPQKPSVKMPMQNMPMKKGKPSGMDMDKDKSKGGAKK